MAVEGIDGGPTVASAARKNGYIRNNSPKNRLDTTNIGDFRAGADSGRGGRLGSIPIPWAEKKRGKPKGKRKKEREEGKERKIA